MFALFPDTLRGGLRGIGGEVLGSSVHFVALKAADVLAPVFKVVSSGAVHLTIAELAFEPVSIRLSHHTEALALALDVSTLKRNASRYGELSSAVEDPILKFPIVDESCILLNEVSRLNLAIVVDSLHGVASWKQLLPTTMELAIQVITVVAHARFCSGPALAIHDFVVIRAFNGCAARFLDDSDLSIALAVLVEALNQGPVLLMNPNLAVQLAVQDFGNHFGLTIVRIFECSVGIVPGGEWSILERTSPHQKFVNFRNTCFNRGNEI